IYGPKGIGALVIRSSVQLVALPAGGSQETRRRGGTQNMIGIAGFAGACQEWPCSQEWPRIARLRDRLEEGLMKLEGIEILGKSQSRVPNTTSVCIRDV